MTRKVLWGFAPVIVIGAMLWRERFSGYHQRLAEGHFAQSEALAHEGDLAGARREMALALKEDPRYAEARDGLATIYSTNGDPSEAIRLYNEGIRLQPRTISLRYDLAELYFQEHRYGEAVSPLEDAIKVDPDFLPGRRLLGICYERTGRAADALRFWQDSVRRHPEDPLMAHSLARFQRQQRDHHKPALVHETAHRLRADRAADRASTNEDKRQ